MATRIKVTDPRDQHPLFGQYLNQWADEIAGNELLRSLPRKAQASIATQMARSSVYQDETVTHR